MSISSSAAELVGAELACACGRYADEKQSTKITILDLRGLSQLCDYFVVCTAGSEPHLKAIRDHVLKELSQEHGVRTNHLEGLAESQWIVLDFIDVIVHIFHKDRRGIYALEDLWADAPRIDWQTGKAMTREEIAESEVSEEDSSMVASEGASSY